MSGPFEPEKKSLTIEDRFQALQRLDQGEKKPVVAASLGVDEKALALWKKHREGIERYLGKPGTSSFVMSDTEGLKAIEKALKYMRQQPEFTSHDRIMMQKWKNLTLKKTIKRGKQKKITDFFKRNV